MTNYIIVDAKKRDFIINVRIPDHSTTSAVKINANDTRVARNGDTRVARNGDIRIAHNTTTVYAPVIRLKKRNFVVQAKVTHG